MQVAFLKLSPAIRGRVYDKGETADVPDDLVPGLIKSGTIDPGDYHGAAGLATPPAEQMVKIRVLPLPAREPGWEKTNPRYDGLLVGSKIVPAGEVAECNENQAAQLVAAGRASFLSPFRTAVKLVGDVAGVISGQEAPPYLQTGAPNDPTPADRPRRPRPPTAG